MDGTHLSQLLEDAAASRPEHPAVEDEHGRTLTYAALARAADRLFARLTRWGVGRGDRVGLFLPKSVEAVAAVHGVLRSGAAYVPADPNTPTARGAGVFADAGVKAVIVAADLAPALRAAWPGPGPCPRLVVVASSSLSPRERGPEWTSRRKTSTGTTSRPTARPLPCPRRIRPTTSLTSSILQARPASRKA